MNSVACARDLGGADGEAVHVRVAFGVPLRRLAGCATDAHHLTSGELVGERARERRATEHDERLEVLGDAHGVGAGGDLVVGEAGALVELEFDRAAVELVELFEHPEHVVGGLLRLGVRVVDAHRVRQIVDDRVVVGTLVLDDLDRVGGDTAGRVAAVVSVERGVALG